MDYRVICVAEQAHCCKRISDDVHPKADCSTGSRFCLQLNIRAVALQLQRQRYVHNAEAG